MIAPVSILILLFSLTYYLAERTGVFGVSPLPPLDVLYSIPILSASLIFLLLTLISALKNFRNMKTSGWLLLIAVILLISGLWLSYFTRFSAEVVLTEGQTFYSGHNDFMADTVYRGRFATSPDIGMQLESIEAEFSGDMSEVNGLEGSFQIMSKDGGELRNIIITDGLPEIIDGTIFTIKDFGYSTRYVLKSKEGRILDSSFIYMKLFPPGSEDSFRLLSPLTYYVRYYPRGSDDSDEPVLGLRIVRNKDIVFNSMIHLKEDASFENSRISFEEVRKWTVLVITHDWGELLVLCGLLLGLACFIAQLLRKIKKKSG